MTDSSGESSDPELEILVHVAAPARASDDAVNRELAQAYLSFAPTISTRNVFFSHGALVNPSLETNAHDNAFDAPEQVVFDSQELSFQSVVDNRLSPRLKHVRNEPSERPSTPRISPQKEMQGHGKGQLKPWETPPSQIGDSYPMPNIASAYTSPRRTFEHSFEGPADPSLSSGGSHPGPSTSEPASSMTTNSPRKIARHSPRRSPRRLHHRLQNETPKQPALVSSPKRPAPLAEPARLANKITQKIIPVTPYALKPAVVRLNDAPSATQQARFDFTHISGTDSSLPALPSSSRSESEPPPSKRPRIASCTARIRQDAASALVRSVSDIGPSSSPSSTSNLTREQMCALEVFAPSPSVGVGNLEPSTMIPENLVKLAEKLSSRYRPNAKRVVDPLERGYWSVDCSAWSSETRRQTWAFLYRYVESGMASWGVWSRRTTTHDSLRLYCWGHMAKHAYLLLYLASERALKYTGADWIDAGGEVVLQVVPAEKRLREVTISQDD